ncbi:MAG TPA: GTPase domain-containing protein [Nannocystaceae bacterium]|nr:GTPase domain-containing protein [Nannocystaceae bacterium]
MALIDEEAHRLDSRVVVYGPAGAGKTAWLEHVYASAGGSEPIQQLGDDPSAPRFDLMWIGLGEIRGFATRFQITTTIGALEDREHRRMLLQHVDGVVFLADALPGRDRDNQASFTELETMLGDWGTPISGGLPLVVFVNKRDLPGALTEAEVAAPLLANRGEPTVPVLGGSATTGDGVLDSFKTIVKLVLGSLAKAG